MPKEDFPVIEIRVSRPWVRCIRFAEGFTGKLTITFVGGHPIHLDGLTRDIRFDKEDVLPVANTFVDDSDLKLPKKTNKQKL